MTGVLPDSLEKTWAKMRHLKMWDDGVGLARAVWLDTIAAQKRRESGIYLELIGVYDLIEKQELRKAQEKLSALVAQLEK